MTAKQVLEAYRLRWQIELTFKRLKSITQLGHVPKYDEKSSRAWLYGKLLIALLTQKMAHIGKTISPWGYLSAETTHSNPWREFQFMLRQLLAAIKPTLHLAQIIQQWNQIRDNLSEPRRKRKPQLCFLT